MKKLTPLWPARGKNSKLNGGIPVRKHAAVLWIFMLLVLCITGCAEQGGNHSVAGKRYVYSGEPDSELAIEDNFTITINDDGTYSYYESLMRSYIGHGKWSVANDVLTLSDDTGAKRINYFLIDGEDLVFFAENSTNFIHVKVKDGERFHGTVIGNGYE